MKFLTFSDTHGSKQAIQDIKKRACGVDFLVCLGDFSDFGLYGELFAKEIQNLNMPLYIVSGNHEEESPHLMSNITQNYPFFKNMENQVLKVGTANFCGCSFSAACVYSKKSKTYYDLQHLTKKVINLSKLIFLTHCPPAKTPTATTRGEDKGSQRILSFIEEVQPELVLCGHVHKPLQRECYIGKSRILNVACEYRILEI